MNKNYWKKGRRDNNEDGIKKYLAQMDIPFVMLYPSQGADLLLFMEGKVVFVEVKNPTASKYRKSGSDPEKRMQELCIQKGIEYIFVETVEDLKDYLRIDDDVSLLVSERLVAVSNL